MHKKSFKVLIIGKVWPEPNSSAAGARMMQLIDVLTTVSASITFASAAAESDFGINLKEYGVIPVSIKLNDSSFDEFISDLQPDLVLFDRFMTEEQFGWRVLENCPEAIRILDTEDLHFLREARQHAWKNNSEFKETDLFNDLAKREIASIIRCDLSLIISKYEMELLTKVFGLDDRLILHVPFLLDTIKKEDIKSWTPINKRNHFISIGNFLHEPNWNAVLYLKEEIWPRIRKLLPGIELHIYGAYPSQKVQQLHNKQEGFLVMGRADDAMEVVGNARVMLAPLRFGAGLKGKLIEAMRCGTPSITTDIGAESMHDEYPWPGAIENEPGEFAASAVEQYKSESKWEKSQEYGIQIINELYRKDEFGERLVDRINELDDNLENHRRHNFMGEILHHHTAASTKYMSKWIEAKNKS